MVGVGAVVEVPELLNSGRMLLVDLSFGRTTATATTAIMMTIIITRAKTRFFLLRGFSVGMDLGTREGGERSFGEKNRDINLFCGCAAAGATAGCVSGTKADSGGIAWGESCGTFTDECSMRVSLDWVK